MDGCCCKYVAAHASLWLIVRLRVLRAAMHTPAYTHNALPRVHSLRRLMYNCRVQLHSGHSCGDGVKNCRMMYSSDDLGATWSNGTLHPEMADPGCKGGIVRYSGPRVDNTSTGADANVNALFAVGTDSTTLRVNDTLWASLDDGQHRTTPYRTARHTLHAPHARAPYTRSTCLGYIVLWYYPG